MRGFPRELGRTRDFVQGLAVDLRCADVIYAGLTDHPYHDESTGDGFRTTRDGGATWEPLGTLTSQHVSCITVHAHDPNHVYLGTGGNGVFVGRVPDTKPKRLPRQDVAFSLACPSREAPALDPRSSRGQALIGGGGAASLDTSMDSRLRGNDIRQPDSFRIP